MNQSENIKALRDALAYAVKQVPELGTVPGIAQALALTADASEDAPDSVLMPREATEAMMHAAEDVPAPRPYGAVYRAMVAARPAPVAATPAPVDSMDWLSGHEIVQIGLRLTEKHAGTPLVLGIARFMTVLGIAIADKCRAAPAAPIAEVTARCLDTIEFTSLLNEWRCGYQYGPSSRTADALAALIEHITEWADRRPAGEHPGRAGLSEIIAESKEVSKGLTSIMADLTASERAKPEPVKATSEKLAAISNDSSFVEHAKLAEGPSERERKQLADWLLRNPVDGGKLKFAGPPEAFGLGLSQVKMMDGEGNEWTLIAGLREGYKTEAERNTTLLRVVKEEFAAEAGQQAGAVDGGDHADNP